MKFKFFEKFTVLGVTTFFVFNCALLIADVDQDEIPPSTSSIDEVLSKLPANEFNHISSIEYDNHIWKVKTLTKANLVAHATEKVGLESTDVKPVLPLISADTPAAHQKKAVQTHQSSSQQTIEHKYLFDPGTAKYLKAGTEQENDEMIPPGMTSLKNAINLAKKQNPNAIINSAEFDHGRWEVNAIVVDKKINTISEMKYIISSDGGTLMSSGVDD